MLTLLLDGVAYGMLLFVLSCGLAVTLGLMNFINLAHGAFAMLGGYVTALLMNRAGVPFLATLPLAFLVPAVVGVVLERTLYRRLYGASPLDQVLFTIGLVFMAMPAANFLLGDQPQQIHLPAYLQGRIELGGVGIGVYRLFTILLCGAIAAGLQVFLVGTRFGARLRAAVDDARAASGLGVNVDGLFAITFAVGSGLAGLGGALAAVRAAAMARDLDNRLASLTLLAAQVDYTEAGELKLFIDHSQIAAIEDLMWEQGTFEGSRMAGTFTLLRSNDLIWSRMVHQILMGETETMTDLAAWATDTTRMPYVMHRDYLRDFYLNNDFAEGRYQVEGRPVSPHDIRTPLFVLGTEADNVAPWRSVFKIHQFADADVTFALTSGGHNQGVVSPPGTPRRHYRLATTKHADPRPDPVAWLASTPPRDGSWWPAWFEWLKRHSGAPVAPPPLGRPEAGLSAQETAPGQYVFG